MTDERTFEIRGDRGATNHIVVLEDGSITVATAGHDTFDIPAGVAVEVASLVLHRADAALTAQALLNVEF